ncbi:MAG: hypothetical protein OXP75_03435 [Rhodospirillales bacterium]|nr:hypothetical protein [Rhodospirillales bacterium]
MIEKAENIVAEPRSTGHAAAQSVGPATSRRDARARHFSVRFPLLPTFALLFGSLCLLAAAPAAAQSPGKPVLTPVTTGQNAPTVTTLSFTVSCVTPGIARVTDYVLWAENKEDPGERHVRYFSAPSHRCTSIPVTVTDLPLRSSPTTYAVRVNARNLRALQGPWSEPVELTTPADTGQQGGPALMASFEGAPSEHDGIAAFTVDVRFSTALDGGRPPTRASFDVGYGTVQDLERVEAGLWRVRIQPAWWRDVTVTLAGGRGCAARGAVCAAGVRALSNSQSVMVGGPVQILTKRSWAREEEGARVRFLVRLSRTVSQAVTVDYATADGTAAWKRTEPATAGADYTAASGRVTFASGERFKFVEVAVLDDALDEGTEHFLLRFSNPRGAYLEYEQRETVGLIRNDDPLQNAWLSRFGRTVGSHVTGAVSERLAGLEPGVHATLAGRAMDLSHAGDGKALAGAMTGLARAFGAPDAPQSGDDPLARRGLSGAWDEPATTAAARPVAGRELLLGSAFHLATEGEGSGPGLAAWGRVAHGSFDGAEAFDGARMRVDGEVVTGTLGADAEWNRVLAGVAVSLSEGEGRFDQPGIDKGSVESRLTTASPYARFRISERVSAWGLVGWGTGDMTVVQGAREATAEQAARPEIVTKTDLGMRMGALGARGALLTQDEAGGMDLALKADALFVRTDSEKAANSAATTADASRLRLLLEGGRAFALGEGATLRPSLEFGVRHDGGDAETGTGVELGGGVAWTDAGTGLTVEAKARMLVAHADSDYEEWGASATARLDPGADGRGLSLSLAPTIGASPGATGRLWDVHDARGLAPGGGFGATRGLQAEAGYGLALFGGRIIGTPNLGFGMSDGGARDWRVGWRLTSAVPNDPGFEVRLDAARREDARGSGAEHGVMLSGALRW